MRTWTIEEGVLMGGSIRYYEMAPRAARLTNSMRDIGYAFPNAVADLVDNSIAAGATEIDVVLHYEGERSYVLVADNGSGLTAQGNNEALRFGSASTYELGDLGRFGLGLKTASLSQCRRVSVISRATPVRGRLSVRTLDLDLIEEFDEWLVVADDHSSGIATAREKLGSSQGTVVVWEDLDRALPPPVANNGWGRRRLAQLAQRTSEHLAMVFHRFITRGGSKRVHISVDGARLVPWDPFARDEPATKELEPVRFELEGPDGLTHVDLRRFVLPPRRHFSSVEAFERQSGPLKWNRQQGIYVYRAGRLVQSGGWNGLRGVDEHTKLARVALDFNTDLDQLFQINVAKMRISLPPAIRQMVEKPIHEVCIQANDAYRRHAGGPDNSTPKTASIDLTDVGLAIRSAALEAGHLQAIAEVEGILRKRSPDISRALGFV